MARLAPFLIITGEVGRFKEALQRCSPIQIGDSRAKGRVCPKEGRHKEKRRGGATRVRSDCRGEGIWGRDKAR